MTSVTDASLDSILSQKQDAGHAPVILLAAQMNVTLKQEGVFAKTTWKASTVRDANLDFLIWNHLILRVALPASALGILLSVQMQSATVFIPYPLPFTLMRTVGAWSRGMALKHLLSGPLQGKISR